MNFNDYLLSLPERVVRAVSADDRTDRARTHWRILARVYTQGLDAKVDRWAECPLSLWAAWSFATRIDFD